VICPDLKALFSGTYRITHDPVCYPDPARPHIKPESKSDPWYYTIPCQYGTIFPWGPDTLAVEVGDHARVLLRLTSLPGVTQRSDTVLFPLALCDRVAAIVKPRRRRHCHLSPEQRAALRDAGATHRFTKRGAPGEFPALERHGRAEGGPGAVQSL
jgi:hypothetical protein